MKSKIKTILVFGGTRYFGKHLVRELIEQGFAVTIATRGKVADSFDKGIGGLDVGIFGRIDNKKLL